MQAEKKSVLTRVSVILLVLSVGHIAAPFEAGNFSHAQTQPKPVAKIRRYACPMHPEVTSSKRGKCPKCGMRLRLQQAERTGAGASTTAPPPAAGPAPAMSSAQIPDARVYDQDGKPLNFFSDLVKGKTVAINFIFTTCTGVCPPLTATFRRVQQNLPPRTPPIQLISISVDPTTDTPERLREFAAKFKAGPGWTFVTGDTSAIDSILRALGTAVVNKADHTPMVLIGNERADYWTRAYGLSSPTVLIQAITEAERQPQKPN